MRRFQTSSFVSDRQALKAKYRQLVDQQNDKLKFREAEFGDAFDPHFQRDRIVSLIPREFGFVKAWPSVGFHRDIYPILTAALKEVQRCAASIKYELRTLSGYYFRYARSGRTKAKYIGDTKLEKEVWPWYKRRHPDTKHTWAGQFQIALAEYDRDVSGIKRESPSAHAWGLALDINAVENDLGKMQFDMPPEFVAIMQKYGFYWGGYFNDIDAMHFEYALGKGASMSRCRFPLGDPNRMGSPIKAYWNTESADTGVGGYYGLGLNRNLHSGVHLVPEDGAQARTPLRAMAPGYIAAVRLPKLDGSSPATRLSTTSTGFVLMRHDLRWRDKEQEEFSDKKTLPLAPT